jgi:flagellin
MASSDIVLSAALRNNLLSLQSTQRNIDNVQLKLATGLKVNSALDNPQSFFTAQSLNNRASDLTRLLDGINLSIQTITEADKGVTALANLLDQAQSIVESARSELAGSTGEARAVGTVDLSETATLIGLGTIAAADQFSIYTTDDDGNQIDEEITINLGDTAYTLAAQITDAFADNENGEIEARVTAEGFLEISSTGGRTFQIRDDVNANNLVTLAGFTALGLDRYFEDVTRGAATAARATIVAGNTINTVSIYEGAGNLAEAGDVLVGGTFTDADGNTILSNLQLGDQINFTVNNSGTITSGAITLAANTTFQDVADQVNQIAAINDYISAEFDSATGQLSLTSLQDSVENLQVIWTTSAVAATRTIDIGLGDPSGNLDSFTSAASLTQDQIFSFNNSTQALDSLAADYNTIREQINQLVVDANFRGVNLLNGDNLTTFFNEDNSSSLTTEGATFTSDGLGLTEASFRSSTDINLSTSQTGDAITQVRNFGSSLATSLSVVQTRRDFTENTVNVLKAGAEGLTVADQNEEGANLLALQTRQQLGVTSLALAAQSQQSVLRLF